MSAALRMPELPSVADAKVILAAAEDAVRSTKARLFRSGKKSDEDALEKANQALSSARLGLQGAEVRAADAKAQAEAEQAKRWSAHADAVDLQVEDAIAKLDASVVAYLATFETTEPVFAAMRVAVQDIATKQAEVKRYRLGAGEHHEERTVSEEAIARQIQEGMKSTLVRVFRASTTVIPGVAGCAARSNTSPLGHLARELGAPVMPREMKVEILSVVVGDQMAGFRIANTGESIGPLAREVGTWLGDVVAARRRIRPGDLREVDSKLARARAALDELESVRRALESDEPPGPRAA